MPEQTSASLYELFDELDVRYWERLIKSGTNPNKEQLAALIEANAAKPLPAWLNPFILKGLKGELKGKPGRPKKSMLDDVRFEVAVAEYKRLLKALAVREEGSVKGAKKRARSTVIEPRHQRAAKMAIKSWGLRMDWRSFLNEISSKK
jgi:hypothetical protein